MNKTLKIILKAVAILLIAVLVFAIVFFAVITIGEYRPDDIETLDVVGTASETLSLGDTLSIMTFNTGYASLSQDNDFFMDGGEMVRAQSKDQVNVNLNKIKEIIKTHNPSILLLQEVDRKSSRSFSVNQVEFYRQQLNMTSTFAYNYNALYVPYPLPTIGTVKSGLNTLSKYATTSAIRQSLPVPFSWPLSSCNLKRCLLVTRYDIEGSAKQLVVVNLHLEAYDDGEGKIEQTRVLMSLLEEERSKGNYVVAGGDFNQTFPGVDMDRYAMIDQDNWTPGTLSTDDLPEGYSYLYDQSTPTCRLLDKPLTNNPHPQYYVIDGFIVSDNVTVTKTATTVDAGFVASDHNPIYMEITLGA